jgi:hypothetical protein
MAALRLCDPHQHTVYWCDVRQRPTPNVAEFLGERGTGAAYICLGEDGADGLIRSLYQVLVSKEAQRDPMQRYRDWRALRRNR